MNWKRFFKTGFFTFLSFLVKKNESLFMIKLHWRLTAFTCGIVLIWVRRLLFCFENFCHLFNLFLVYYVVFESTVSYNLTWNHVFFWVHLLKKSVKKGFANIFQVMWKKNMNFALLEVAKIGSFHCVYLRSIT